MSVQLKDAWLSISKMKTVQEVHSKELAKSQETNTSLTTDLTNVRDQLKTTKNELSRDKARWNADRENLEAQIKSLKVLYQFRELFFFLSVFLWFNIANTKKMFCFCL